MVGSAIGNAITEMTSKLSSLRVFGNKKATTTIDNIKLYLSSIKEMEEHGDAVAPSPDCLMDITDVINDLWDLLESNTSSLFLSLLRHTPRGLLVHLREIEERLQRIVDDDSTNQPLLNDGEMGEMEMPAGLFEKDKNTIKKSMLALTTVKGAVAVVAVSGIRGSGKTTLAKLVRDDESVKSHFDDMVFSIDNIPAESYAEFVVQQMVLQLSTKKNKVEDNDSSVVIDENLKESFGRRKFLLVLDGLQNENADEWRKLKEKLKEAASSSSAAVLVTTQNSLVPSAIDADDILIPKLSEEDSWTLFKQVVREDPSEPEVKDAQKKMVSKCGGVPLAILTMARLWMSRGEIGDLEEAFMQKMKLIYYQELPSWHLKQCFAYLSFIFPRPKFFVMEESLTRLWKAEGLLGPLHVMNSNNYSSSSSSSSSSSASRQPQPEELTPPPPPPPQQPQPEQLAHNCIQELSRRSILYFRKSQYENLTKCSVNNELMYDLSRFVAGKDHFWMVVDNGVVKETVRRVALAGRDFFISDGTLSSLFKNDKISLRTLIWDRQLSEIPQGLRLRYSTCDAILWSFESLRVLKLSDLGISMLPVSIGGLKSIKYLDLSGNNMKTLPRSIGKLKHLQTLRLSHCLQLKELPNELKYLVSLRHLEIDECLNLTHLPSTLKKLTNLETLSNFVVNTFNNHKHILGFKELVNLKNLSGQLEISHLERLKFRDGYHDAAAYLKEKQHLKSLILNWNHDDDSVDNKQHDERSLEQLEPHPNLLELRIVGYGSVMYSSWLSSLNNLVGLSLYNCSMCKSLPPWEQFPKLKYLDLQRLDSLEYITDQEEGCCEQLLKHLQNLSITDCPNLISWWKGNTPNNVILFGAIKVMKVKYCPKLNSMPLFPNLDRRLELEGSSLKPLLDTINYSGATLPPLFRVRYLRIKNVEQHSLLPEDWLKNLVSLQGLLISERMSLIKGFEDMHLLSRMVIEKCTRVDLPSVECGGLQSLDYLALRELDKMKSLPEGIKHLTSLTQLYIDNCPELETLTEAISHLKSLEKLWIVDCHKLASLPKEMKDLKSLKVLTIRSCPLLLPRCQEGTGDDWQKIKHIKDIHLVGASEAYDQ